MLKPMILTLAGGMAAAATVTAVPIAAAAELQSPARVVHMRHHHDHRVCWCGACGCLNVRYVHHRELRSTYGVGFDPRNFDQTEPHYYFGPVQAYPRYWVGADPVR